MKTCKTPNCTNQATRKGLCNAHYMRQYRRTHKPKGTYDDGYSVGLDDGRTQVANAISDALDSHGVSCRILDNTLYLRTPTKTYELDLSQ